MPDLIQPRNTRSTRKTFDSVNGIQDELQRRAALRLFDHFDNIRYFLAGIEIYPLTIRVSIGHASVSLALNPYQHQARLNQPAGLIGFPVGLGIGFHWHNHILAYLPGPRQRQSEAAPPPLTMEGSEGSQYMFLPNEPIFKPQSRPTRPDPTKSNRMNNHRSGEFSMQIAALLLDAPGMQIQI